MPSEHKLLTGLFKWKDIKRWHTTWHAFLCKHSGHLFVYYANGCRSVPLVFAFMAQFGQSGQSSKIDTEALLRPR